MKILPSTQRATPVAAIPLTRTLAEEKSFRQSQRRLPFKVQGTRTIRQVFRYRGGNAGATKAENPGPVSAPGVSFGRFEVVIPLVILKSQEYERYPVQDAKFLAEWKAT
jgi:hypothetical protein